MSCLTWQSLSHIRVTIDHCCQSWHLVSGEVAQWLGHRIANHWLDILESFDSCHWLLKLLE